MFNLRNPGLKLETLFPKGIPKTWEIIGSGGKTTTLIVVADLLSKLKKNVLYTTSTHLASWAEEPRYVGRFVEFINIEQFRQFWLNCQDKSCILTARYNEERTKLVGLTSEELNWLCDLDDLDHLLVEADGSRSLPVKAHAAHEPVLFSKADLGVAVIGLRGLGRTVTEKQVHRPQLLRQLLQCEEDHVISGVDFVKIACAYLDLLPTKERMLVLSQAEAVSEEVWRELARQMGSIYGQVKIVVQSLQDLKLAG